MRREAVAETPYEKGPEFMKQMGGNNFNFLKREY
jgi:hypothetical protein